METIEFSRVLYFSCSYQSGRHACSYSDFSLSHYIFQFIFDHRLLDAFSFFYRVLIDSRSEPLIGDRPVVILLASSPVITTAYCCIYLH